jgi:hypothetical protein
MSRALRLQVVFVASDWEARVEPCSRRSTAVVIVTDADADADALFDDRERRRDSARFDVLSMPTTSRC